MKLKRGRMKRWSITVAMTSATLGLAACGDSIPADQVPADPAPADVSGPNGRIAFVRLDPSLDDEEAKVTYTVNPDGSDVEQLFTDGFSSGARWSPDGTQISIFCCDDGMAAHLLDPETGDVRGLPPQDPTLETHCGGDGLPTASDSPARSSAWTTRAATGSTRSAPPTAAA